MKLSRAVIRFLSNTPVVPTSHNVGYKSVLLSKGETPSAVTQIAVSILKAGDRVEAHTHKTMDEHFFFIDGNGIISVGDLMTKCVTGLFVLVPAGDEHWIEARTDMTFLTIGVAL